MVLKIPLCDIGPFINKCLSDKNLDLSEENLLRVGLLLKALYEDPQEDLDPHAQEDSEDPAEMNMTFFLYIIRDILDHAGFTGDKTKNAAKIAARQLKMALGKFNYLEQKTQYMSKVLGILG